MIGTVLEIAVSYLYLQIWHAKDDVLLEILVNRPQQTLSAKTYNYICRPADPKPYALREKEWIIHAIQKLSPSQLKALTDLLSDYSAIASLKGVLGICTDGSTIVRKLSSEMDLELLKENSASIFKISQHAVLAMNHNDLEEIILNSRDGFLYLRNFGMALIVLVSESDMTEVFE